MSTPRKNWARDELLVAFNLYCRTPFGRLHQSNPDVVAAAKALGRTPGSVAMKLVNFASLDPVQKARGIKGLKNAAAADEDVFKEFDQDWERLAVDSEAAMAHLAVIYRAVFCRCLLLTYHLTPKPSQTRSALNTPSS